MISRSNFLKRKIDFRITQSEKCKEKLPIMSKKEAVLCIKIVAQNWNSKSCGGANRNWECCKQLAKLIYLIQEILFLSIEGTRPKM